MLLDLIGWVVIGLIVGAIARFLIPGKDPMGCIATSLLGIVGAFLGGWISRFFIHTPQDTYARPGFFISLLGAIVVLLIVRMVRR